MAKKKTGSNVGKIGLGMAAVTAAAAGAYYLYGSKDAKQNRKTASDFVKKARKTIVKEAKKGMDAAPELGEKISKEIKKVKKAVAKKMQ